MIVTYKSCYRGFQSAGLDTHFYNLYIGKNKKEKKIYRKVMELTIETCTLLLAKQMEDKQVERKIC